MEALILRKIRTTDSIQISQAFAAQGWDKPAAQYERYFVMQEAGERDIIVAELAGEFAGYLTIQWTSSYQPFSEAGIPEIVDFNVLQKFQRKGIGTALMDEAEKRVAQVSPYCGIGVGVSPDYGAAQILYARRNYIPDGRGLMRNSKPLNYGDKITIDDDIVFHLIKELGSD